MADHDEDVPTIGEEMQYAQDLQNTLRAFEVVMLDGSVVRVFAHFWTDENPGGHIHFCTLQPSGRLLIHNLINGRGFVQVREVTPASIQARIDQIAAREQAFQRGHKALDTMRRQRPDRRTH